jgi:imidazolonepropionase
MERRVLIHGARQLLTLRGTNSPRRGHDLSQLHIIEDGAILIGDGKILEVGPSRRLENLASARRAEAIPAHGRVVMPAFVDPDTRALRPAATYAETFNVHLPECPCANSYGSGARVRHDGEVTLEGMLRHGTATVETKGSDIRLLRVIAQMESAIEVIPTFDARCGVSEDVLDLVRKRCLARFVQCRAGSDEAAQRTALDTLRYARGLGFGIRQCWVGTSHGFGTELQEGVDAVIRPNALGDEDVAALSVSNTVAVLAPGIDFHRGAISYPPAAKLIAGGAALALATAYGPYTNPSYSMAVTVSLACRKLGMRPAEAITAATINAAHALGIGRRAGSLEPGKQADILILQTGDYRAMAWEFGINLVGMVIKAGEVVYDAESPGEFRVMDR